MKRTQNGSLIVAGTKSDPRWYGRYYANLTAKNGKIIRKQIRVPLGALRNMTREQAREKLDDVIRKNETLSYRVSTVIATTQMTTDAPPENVRDRGAYGELLACADLLRRGFRVFKAVSAICPYDLIAERDGQFVRIEVKFAAATTKAGAPLPDTYASQLGNFDVLMLVMPNGSVHYFDGCGNPAQTKPAASHQESELSGTETPSVQ